MFKCKKKFMGFLHPKIERRRRKEETRGEKSVFRLGKESVSTDCSDRDGTWKES